jgi:hypothetical protein
VILSIETLFLKIETYFMLEAWQLLQPKKLYNGHQRMKAVAKKITPKMLTNLKYPGRITAITRDEIPMSNRTDLSRRPTFVFMINFFANIITAYLPYPKLLNLSVIKVPLGASPLGVENLFLAIIFLRCI